LSSSNLSRSYGTGSFLDLLSGPDLVTLKAAAVTRVFQPGSALARQGESASYVIFIDSGWALETSFAGTGTETVLRVLGPGDIVGDYAALTGRSRESTVTCLRHIKGAVVTADRFTTLLERNPAISLALSRVLEQRLREADHRIRIQAAYSGGQRLAGLLLDLADRYGAAVPGTGVKLDFPLSQEQLASWAGVSRETVVRALTQWRRHGLVRTGRRKIDLLDMAALRKIAADSMPAPVALSRDAPRPRTGRTMDTTIVAIDIENFGRLRDNASQHVRTSLYEMLQHAFSESRVPLADCRTEDRGDGILVAAPPAIPSQTFINALIARLPAELRRHNQLASESPRIRLRIAVHAGFVHFDANGMTGRAITHLFRLLDAPALKDALQDSFADLGVIMSDRIRKTTAQQAPGLVAYRPRSGMKIGTTLYWIHVPPPPQVKDHNSADHPAPGDRHQNQGHEPAQGGRAN